MCFLLDQYTKLYHHTDKMGSKAIARSQQINQSIAPKKKGTDDARHGTGTYLTSLGPETSKMDVARNNYGPNAAAAMVRRGKADVAIGLTVPKKSVEQVPGNRDIFVRRGVLQLRKDVKPTFNLRHRDGTVTEHGISSAEQSEFYSESERDEK